jgi:hypothetical protein
VVRRSGWPDGVQNLSEPGNVAVQLFRRGDMAAVLQVVEIEPCLRLRLGALVGLLQAFEKRELLHGARHDRGKSGSRLNKMPHDLAQATLGAAVGGQPCWGSET